MNNTLSDRLKYLYNSGRDFAAFRLPRHNQVGIIANSTETDTILIRDYEDLNGKSGFVFAPFSITKEYPCVLLPYNTVEEYPAPIPNTEIPAAEETGRNSSPSEEYIARYTAFITALQEGEYRKLVLSRSRTINFDSFPTVDAFISACHHYPELYIYMYKSEHAGTWLGCTPEPILTGESGNMQTVAMAGTQLSTTNSEWSKKDTDEQAAVSEHIKARLDRAGIECRTTGAYPFKAGHLTHLRTDFNFRITGAANLGSILKSLHPTPAVSGLPQRKAVDFILNNEGYERKYYSGFLGMINPDGRSDLYVNLRCMNILPRCVTLYAGGGLLSTSTLDSEWKETEEKLRTITSIPHICIQIKKAYSI
jgi:isochorismate synthase